MDDYDDESEDFLTEVREKFDRAQEVEHDNRTRAQDDIEFVKLAKQWPIEVERLRAEEGRPCLTINHLSKFVRRVVNGARANRPSIEVVPSDSGADPATAEVIAGLIRNIQVASDADIAYDKAVEYAVSGGFGYFRVNLDYTADDSFDKDITIEPIGDPFTVFGDPDSESADGSDWNCCFVAKSLTRDEFADRYRNADKVDWHAEGYVGLPAPWVDGDHVMVVEYWKREDVESEIVLLNSGQTMETAAYEEQEGQLAQIGLEAVATRVVRSKKVTQYVCSGAEVLEEVEWPGRYIPIVPVYGEEFFFEGKRQLKSLICDAKDAQRDHNFWRSCASETIALAPKVPFIGPKGAFDLDVEKWSTINRRSWPYVEYDGPVMPQRVPNATPSSGELQQAQAAVDDIKAIIGIFDSSLGEQSNETSGVAIRQRQSQSDTVTFHFIDNLQRAIRHCGRILVDLIPRVYSTRRIIRILGEDQKPRAVAIGPQDAMERAQAITNIFDLSVGRYDVVVKAGPSWGTQREFARAEMTEIIRNLGQDASRLMAPLYLRNSDWPGADEMADKLEAINDRMMGPPPSEGPPPEMQAQMQRMMQDLQKLSAENQQLKLQLQNKAGELQIDAQRLQIDAQKIAVDQQKAQAQLVGSMAKAQADARAASNPMGLAR